MTMIGYIVLLLFAFSTRVESMQKNQKKLTDVEGWSPKKNTDIDEDVCFGAAQRAEEMEMTRGLSTLSGASGSGGVTMADTRAAKRVLGVCTSDPQDPDFAIPSGQTVSRRVVHRPNVSDAVSDEIAADEILQLFLQQDNDDLMLTGDVAHENGGDEILALPGDGAHENNIGDGAHENHIEDGAEEHEGDILVVPDDGAHENVLPGDGDSDILVLPGVDGDESVGEPGFWTPAGARAPIWFFFRCKVGQPKSSVYCQIPNCKAPHVKANGSTTNMYMHLKRRHSINNDMVRLQARGECPCGQCPSDSKPHGTTPLEDNTTAPAAKGKAKPAPAPVQGKIKLPLPPKAAARVSEAFVRSLIINDGRPMRICETTNFRNWLRTLLDNCGATHSWCPPSHTLMRDMLQRNESSMRAALQQCISSVPEHAVNLHWDCWTDPIGRVWAVGYFFFLDLEFLPCSLVVAFEDLALRTGPDFGSSHSPAVVAASLQHSIQQLGLTIPMWGLTDNENKAQAVANEDCLDIRKMHCLAHLIVIPIKRLLQKPDKGVYRQKAPKTFQSLERLREYSKFYYKKADRKKEWKRLAGYRNGRNIAAPKIDSSSKWEATKSMVAHYVENKELYEHVASRVDQHPAAPDEEESQDLVNLLPILDHVWAANQLLQDSQALAASFFPIFFALSSEIEAHAAHLVNQFGAQVGFENIGEKYLNDLKERIEAHLSHPIPVKRDASGHVHASWSSVKLYLQCASLCLPQFRNGLHLSPDDRSICMRRLGQHFLSMYMREAGYSDANAVYVVEDAPRPVVMRSRGSTRFDSAPMQNIINRMIGLSGNRPGLAREPVLGLGSRPLTIAHHVTHVTTTFFETPQSDIAYGEFWRTTISFSVLRPGAHAMLSHSSGNGFGERIFSYSLDWLSRKRSLGMDIRLRTLLYWNGPALEMPGYENAGIRQATQQEQQQEDDDDVDDFP